MNWIERILSSDAGRGAPELAKKMVEWAGGEIPAADSVNMEDVRRFVETSRELDEVKPEVLKGEYS